MKNKYTSDNNQDTPINILQKVRKWRKKSRIRPISEEIKKEMNEWISENYKMKIDLLLIHDRVMTKRIKFLEDLKKEDPYAHVTFMPITFYYKEEIKKLYD